MNILREVIQDKASIYRAYVIVALATPVSSKTFKIIQRFIIVKV